MKTVWIIGGSSGLGLAAEKYLNRMDGLLFQVLVHIRTRKEWTGHLITFDCLWILQRRIAASNLYRIHFFIADAW